MSESSALLGVVLCGGKSTRMGRDKGLIFKENKPWSLCQFHKLKSRSLPVVVSVNKSQAYSYQKHFNSKELVLDLEQAKGPLDGLFSVHHSYPDKDLLILACDLVDLGEVLLQRLINEYSICKNSWECFVFGEEGGIEPLCGIYSSEVLTQYTGQNKKGELSDFSLKTLLKMSKTKYLKISSNEKTHFANYNHFKDLGS